MDDLPSFHDPDGEPETRSAQIRLGGDDPALVRLEDLGEEDDLDDEPTRQLESERIYDAGQVLAKKYVLERIAGFGGMAQLWVAVNQATGAEVCVKLLVPKSTHREAVERFRREAHAAAKLSHRAIVRVFDLLELDDAGEIMRATGDAAAPRAYAIVMEYLRGETLAERLAKEGNLPLEEALDIILPVISALAHAHRASVIHRDIKPDNIFLARDPDGHVTPKVLDFGVSKLMNTDAITMDGVLVGTPCFMSPEQAKGGQTLDARSDVFSLGILLYMMLVGRNPFEDAPTFATALDAVIRREVPPIPDLSPAIWEVIDKALRKDPNARWSDATELGLALRKAAGRKVLTESLTLTAAAPLAEPAPEPDPTEVTTDGNTYDAIAALPGLSPASRRRRSIIAGVVGALAAVLVAGGGLAIALRRGALSSSPAATPPLSTASVAPAVASPPAAPPSPAAAPSASGVEVSEPSPVDPAPPRSDPVAPTASGTRPVAGAPVIRPPPPSGPRRTPAAASSGRKPGEEPNNARDPGF